MDPERVSSESDPLATPNARRRPRDVSSSDPPRTLTACQNCRNKKVKCSGDQPCTYCAKRSLVCVFSACEKKKLFSVSQIRDLENKVALYESQDRSSQAALPSPQHDAHFRPTLAASSTRDALPELGATLIEGVTPRLEFTTLMASNATPTASTPSNRFNNRTRRALAPTSALSSSETFSSEVRDLLVARHTPATDTPESTLQGPRKIDRQALKNIRSWPIDDAEAHSLLETVVLNVGISQQLFDIRAFSDHLSMLFEDDEQDLQISRLWLVEVLLVFAIGRLLQAKPADILEIPGTSLWNEAMRHLPQLTELRKQDVLGIEVMGLSALYLQVADRKEDAYVHSNTALRLAVTHGMHRQNQNKKLRRSESVHRNRLWWTVYMQERRLAAACGHPTSISDNAIRVDLPSDFAGFPSASALRINVQLAQINGQITSEIYGQESESEAAFIAKVQRILTTLDEVEKKMPAEYNMEVQATRLTIAGRPAGEISQQTARTSASLYLTIYRGVIYTVRPVLLHLAKYSREADGALVNEIKPTLRRLAEFCVEAARKSLVILQELRNQKILTKHAFLDLDAIFSVGFIFVLVEAINPGRGLGINGIDGARSILRYLVDLGNKTAMKRLAEIDQMCAHLSLQPGETPQNFGAQPQTWDPVQEFLTQPFSFTQENRSGMAGEGLSGASDTGPPNFQTRQSAYSDQPPDGMSGQDSGFQFTDLSNMSLEGENDLYLMYHTPGFSFTGVDLADWEALERQTTWNLET